MNVHCINNDYLFEIFLPMKRNITLLSLAIILAFPTIADTIYQDQFEQKKDSTNSTKSKKKPLPLEPAREISFTTTESSWMSHPRQARNPGC